MGAHEQLLKAEPIGISDR